MKSIKYFIYLMGTILLISGVYTTLSAQDFKSASELYESSEHVVKTDDNSSSGVNSSEGIKFMPKLHGSFNWTNKTSEQEYQRGEIKTH